MQQAMPRNLLIHTSIIGQYLININRFREGITGDPLTLHEGQPEQVYTMLNSDPNFRHECQGNFRATNRRKDDHRLFDSWKTENM